jgi:DNA polymerase III alpha subunit
MSEARRLGLVLRPPHINHSQSEFTTAYPQGDPILYMGLDQVRGLTHHTQKRIIQKRPFQSLADFILRADPRLQEAESLIRVGAMEGLGPIPGLLMALNEGIWRSSQPSLFSASIDSGQEPDWSLEKKLEAQTTILGIGVEAHPLEIYQDQIAAFGTISTLEAVERIGHRVRVVGVRQSMRRSRTSQGEIMAFLSIEDQEGMLDAVIFPGVYRQHRSAFTSSAPLMIEGTMELDESHTEPYLRVEKAELLGK